jgi:hypothetical protein
MYCEGKTKKSGNFYLHAGNKQQKKSYLFLAIFFFKERWQWQCRILNYVILIFLEVFILGTNVTLYRWVMGGNFFVISQRKSKT